jgi:hypothetical protein
MIKIWRLNNIGVKEYFYGKGCVVTVRCRELALPSLKRCCKRVQLFFMAGLLLTLGFTGLPLVGFALFKAIYTGLMAFVIVRWVILKQLLPVSQT